VGAHGRAGDDAAVDGGRRDDSGRLHGEESAHVIKTGITNFAANCFITSFAAQTITNVYLFIPFAGLYSPDHSTYAEPPSRFEAGTPAIAEAIALGAACDYLMKIGMDRVHAYEVEIGGYLYRRLSEVMLSLLGGVRLATWTTRTRLMGCTHSRGVSDWPHVRPELDLWVALTPGGCQIGGHGRPELDLWVGLTPGGCQMELYEMEMVTRTSIVPWLHRPCRLSSS
jgi:hypothetical protein